MKNIKWVYANKGIFKIGLLLIGLAIIALDVAYIQKLVDKLRQNQRENVELNINLYSQIASADESDEIDFIFDNIIRRINLPIILTSPEGEPVSHINIDNIARAQDYGHFPPEIIQQLNDMIVQMDKENPPQELMYMDMNIGTLHYGDSELIRWLNLMPYIQVFVVGMFILLGFLGFNFIRKSEQRFIWVGMAKETAHQLGTPISSLSGWIELLKQPESQDNIPGILEEMERDTGRLSRVAQRFSQIGSNSDFSNRNIADLLHETVVYFSSRIPQTGKRVIISEDYNVKPISCINKDLLGWAIENLIKNGLDALENKGGEITVKLTLSHGWINIDISDTGKGMSMALQQDIFKPGYSTKKRGWGLGLNLAKRIVEDYHKGKLYVHDSKVGEGSTMRISIKPGTENA